MKLHRQTYLTFRRGASTKVYEVDLLEVGTDQYVVNFRYGKLGGSLKDGSKTPLPVSQREAGTIFDKLVGDKVEQGYQLTAGDSVLSQPSPHSAPIETTPSESAPAPSNTAQTLIDALPQGRDAREQVILARLAMGEISTPSLSTPQRGQSSRRQRRGRGQRQPSPPKIWSLSRAVWRAGELGITAAESLLLGLLNRDASILNYSVIWALGRCGSRQAINSLQDLMNAPPTEPIRHITNEALLRLWNDDERDKFRRQRQSLLPAPLGEAIVSDDPARVEEALSDYLQNNPGAKSAQICDELYTLALPVTRTALIRWLHQVDLTSPAFAAVRSVLKRAEYRRDGELFGLIAHRLETSRAKSGDRQRPFGHVTRDYLRRRVWRTLRRLGEDGSDDYVPMATGVLLAFSDDDAQAVREGYLQIHSRRQRVYWDRFAAYWALNHILYRHSPRYVGSNARRFWHCAQTYRPGDPSPTQREEAFPALWNAQPEYLLTLLEQSRCKPVHEFASRALGDCADFCRQIETTRLLPLLNIPYLVTVAWSAEWLMVRFNPDRDDLTIPLALAHCRHPPARQQAQRWLRQMRQRLLTDDRALAQLISGAFDDTRQMVGDLLRATPLADELARRIVARVIAELGGWSEATAEDSDEQEARATAIAELLREVFGPQLAVLGIAVIDDLLAHPLVALQSLAANILFHYHRPDDVPLATLERLLAAESPPVYSVGLRLVGRWSPEQWAERLALLAQLCASRHAAVRDFAAPLVTVVTDAQPQTATVLARYLAERLLSRRLADEVPAHLKALINALGKLEAEPTLIWRLLNSRRSPTQQLGSELLPQLDATTVSVDQIVELASHETLAVRRWAWQTCTEQSQRLSAELPKAVKLLDSSWDDTRRWAFGFFQENIAEHHWEAAILVAVCDSVREDVQQFGRQLLTRFFNPTSGSDYLLKLSEHPSQNMQLFVSQLLEQYASGTDRLAQLTPFFISVLSAVHRGRVIKTRVLDFLEREALASEAAARIVTPILTRQSATVVTRDKAILLQIMVRLKQRYPALNLPIKPLAVEMRM